MDETITYIKRFNHSFTVPIIWYDKKIIKGMKNKEIITPIIKVSVKSNSSFSVFSRKTAQLKPVIKNTAIPSIICKKENSSKPVNFATK